MTTWTIEAAAPVFQTSGQMSWGSEDMLETDSSTFAAGDFIVLTSGLLAQAADPVTNVYGMAKKDGQNGTSKTGSIYPVVDGFRFFANFLTNAGAANALAAGDLGTDFDVHLSSVGPGSSAIFHGSDTTAATSAIMVNFQADQNPAGQTTGKSVAADTSARVQFTFLDDVRQYNT